MSSSDSIQITYNVSELVAYDYFGYEPSLALAGTALALFLFAGLVIGIQIYIAKNNQAKHMYLVTTTGFTEAAGYCSLIWLIHNTGRTNIYGSYVAMQVFTVLSPNLLQAANYATVGKVAYISGMSKIKRFLRPAVLTWIFIVADIFALCIQAVGISIWASTQGTGKPEQSLISIGAWITVGGLALQLGSFAVFTFLAAWIQRHPLNQMRNTRGHRKIFLGIYLTIALVTIRNTYRFVEFTQGAILPWAYSEDAFVLSENEALFYCFDALPILLCFVCYFLFNPANLLPKKVQNPTTVDQTSEESCSESKSSLSSKRAIAVPGAPPAAVTAEHVV